MSNKIWVIVLSALAVLNLAFFASDPTRWWSMVAAMSCAAAVGIRLGFAERRS